MGTDEFRRECSGDDRAVPGSVRPRRHALRVATSSARKVAAPNQLRGGAIGAKLAATGFVARLQALLCPNHSLIVSPNTPVHLTYEDLSPEVVHEVKRRVIDSFGCALGAWHEEPCAIARKVASDFSAKNGGTDYRHRSPGAARLGGVRDRLLHPLFRLQRHLSFQRTGAPERQHRRRARRRGERRREWPRTDHRDRARL